MIALWVSWVFLLMAFGLTYKLLMDRDAWKVHFVEMSAIAEPLPTPWHKSKVMLTVIQGLLACSALSLLMHFVLPHSIDGQNIQPLSPVPQVMPVNHTNHTNLVSLNDSKQCTEGYILDWSHTAFNADSLLECQAVQALLVIAAWHFITCTVHRMYPRLSSGLVYCQPFRHFMHGLFDWLYFSWWCNHVLWPGLCGGRLLRRR
jgi:hypothetical protein